MLAALLLGAASQALAAPAVQETRGQVPLAWTQADRPFYFDVPREQRYEGGKLRVTAAPGSWPAGTPPTLWLDGQPLATRPALRDRPGGERTLTYALPPLEPGNHALQLRPGAGVVPAPPRCDRGALPLTAAALDYRPVVWREPLLSDLPQALYVLGPGQSVVVGNIEADWDDAALSAALALAQALGERRAVVWQDAREATLPPTFTLRLRRDPALGVPARLDLRAPRELTVSYRDAAGLTQAAQTLTLVLGRAGRPLPARAQAEIRAPVPVPAATLRPPTTLSDYGLSAYEVRSGESVTQALRLPAAWVASRPLRGELAYRLTGDARTAQVTLRAAGKQTDLSPARAQQAEGPQQGEGAVPWRAAFAGDQPPEDGAAELRLTLRAARCEDVLKVDPVASRLDLRPRLREGLASLPAALLRDPSIRLTPTPQSVTLALNIAASLPSWGLEGTLPWRASLVTSASEEKAAARNADATLTLMTRSAQRVGSDLRVRSGAFGPARFEIVSASRAATRDLGLQWAALPAQLTDGLTQARVLSGGQVEPGRDAAGEAREARWQWQALGFSLVTLPLAGWLSARRFRREQP